MERGGKGWREVERSREGVKRSENGWSGVDRGGSSRVAEVIIKQRNWTRQRDPKQREAT